MRLEGTVTNVAAFGAFVDIGVHQDGLVHVSQLADRFVKDPHEVVKAGDVVKVRVVEVDVARKRIALTMRSGEIEASTKVARAEPQRGRSFEQSPRGGRDAGGGGLGSLGAKLSEALERPLNPSPACGRRWRAAPDEGSRRRALPSSALCAPSPAKREKGTIT